MILLDTNVVSELMKSTPNPGVIRWLDDHVAAEVFIPSITKAEIELGIGLLPGGKRKTALSEAASTVLNAFATRCLSFDCPASKHYAQIVTQRTRSGKPISIEDAQIAAIALYHRLTIATRNVRDFEDIPQLRLINPWQSDTL